MRAIANDHAGAIPRSRMRRPPAAGLLLFLVKGLAWLAVPAAIGALNLLALLR